MLTDIVLPHANHIKHAFVGFADVSLVYIISAVGSPIFGFAIDKTGRNVVWVFSGCAITLACHAALAFTFINPFVSMVSRRAVV